MDPNVILLLNSLNAIFEGTMTLDGFRELAGSECNCYPNFRFPVRERDKAP